jgi:hypothetical protein
MLIAHLNMSSSGMFSRFKTRTPFPSTPNLGRDRLRHEKGPWPPDMAGTVGAKNNSFLCPAMPPAADMPLPVAPAGLR